MSYTYSTDDLDAFVNISEPNTSHQLYSRLQELSSFYGRQFSCRPQFFVRVPGRVNIIGEHVDYCGYPVLPLAIDQCIILAVGYSQSNTLLHLRNIQADKFENFECDLNTLNITRAGGPKWYKYYLCGVKGIYETLGERWRPFGMTVALDGNIPPASGLSSSSALVSASVLATAYIHQVPLERKRLALISANCERYIGTQGGGMDQAIAYLSKEGCAQLIEFHPELSATSVQLPKSACFVVANSLSEVNKAASSQFNERVVECRLGSRIIAKRMQCINWQNIVRFVNLQETLKCSLIRLENLVMKHLPQEKYTRKEICDELNVSKQTFQNEFLTENTYHMTTFKLQQRALHVIQESLRVAKFRAICNKMDEGIPCRESRIDLKSISESYSTDMVILSQLIRKSHDSLKSLYECSHADLDRLIDISDEFGVSARLMGAGWGGCIVALCDSSESAEKYIQALKEKYFSQLPIHIREKCSQRDYSDVVFATYPRTGAEIFTSIN